MELSWINKLRIAAVAALGILVVGLLAWPLAAPADPLLPVRAWHITPFGTIALLLLALTVGFAAYFIAWPHGREVGILAVPMGLIIWAGRSGPISILNQVHRETSERQALLCSLSLEPIYWLLIVAAGFAGVLVAQYLCPQGNKSVTDCPPKRYRKVNLYVNGLAAVLVAVVVSQLSIGALVQNLGEAGAVTQPDMGQIIFGVTAAFALAAFVVKKLLHLSYVWPAVASSLVLASAQALCYTHGTVQKFAETRPATFFPHNIFTVLPLQLVALGSLGSVIGYWMAVRYDYWRQHESESAG